jgi:hypothetical protein
MKDDIYWFKRKTYGWGWYPATWQGWSVLAVYFVLLALILSGLERNQTVLLPADMMRMIGVFVLTAVLIGISYATGESPRWQWGRRK